MYPRSYRAPTSSSLVSGELYDNRIFKDEEFCAWNIETVSCDVKTKPHLKVSTTKQQCLLNYKKSQPGSNAKFKLTRWYLHEKESFSFSPDLVFQHYTDLNKYMEKYRENKLEKIKRDLKYVPATSEISALERNRSKQNERGICFQYMKNSNEAYAYRMEKHKKLSNGSLQQVKGELQIPIKVLGSRYDYDDLCCFNVVKSSKKQSSSLPPAKQFNLPPAKQFNLPKYDTVILPSKSVYTDNLQPEHILHCKRLNELSLNNFAPTCGQGWRAQAIRTREKIKLKSAQDKTGSRLHETTNGIKYSDYSQIIKRVLEHYDDPSQNPVRGFPKDNQVTTGVSKDNNPSSNVLLAT